MVNLGNLKVKNKFLFDADSGTLTFQELNNKQEQEVTTEVPRNRADTTGSDSSEMQAMSKSVFDDLTPPINSHLGDPMMTSCYGSLDQDFRLDSAFKPVLSVSTMSQIYDPTDLDVRPTSPPPQGGSSVDPSSPKFPLSNPVSPTTSHDSLSLSGSARDASRLRLGLNTASSSSMDVTSAEYMTPQGFSGFNTPMSPSEHLCLLDVLSIELSEMDLFSGERVDKRTYTKDVNFTQDLEFHDCMIQRQVATLLFCSRFKVFMLLFMKIHLNLWVSLL